MTDTVTPELLAELRKLIEAVQNNTHTPGPWAWEQYGEKSNNWGIGVAFAAADEDCTNPLRGHVQTSIYDEKSAMFVDHVIWHRVVGDHEDASDGYILPQYICRADPTTVLALLDRIEADAQRIKELETWGARFRRDYGIPPEGSLGATWEATDGD